MILATRPWTQARLCCDEEVVLLTCPPTISPLSHCSPHITHCTFEIPQPRSASYSQPHPAPRIPVGLPCSHGQWHTEHQHEYCPCRAWLFPARFVSPWRCVAHQHAACTQTCAGHRTSNTPAHILRAHTHAHTHTCTHAHTHAHTHARTPYTHMHMHMHMHICTHARMHSHGLRPENRGQETVHIALQKWFLAFDFGLHSPGRMLPRAAPT
eukprot:2721722-Rhodomonas_salina.1